MVMAKDLVQACHETGFVYITNHGIPPELLNKAFALSKSFYALPQDQKLQAGHSEGSTAFRGYSWPGLEKASYTYPGAENVDDGVAGEGIDLTVRSVLLSSIH
jgi:isopenicillin N synthase-like dioxygenase